jgi:hypothetical protein
MLESVPRLNPVVRWDRLDSGEIMAVYEKGGRGLHKVLRRLFALPEVAQLLLDEVGAKVVGQIDGAKTVDDLIGFVSDEFRLSRKEAEVSLLGYMEMLGKRQLVGFEITPRREEDKA